MAPKIKVKERLSADGEIDLSMSDLEEVPIKEIIQFKKAHSLDLSNNRLVLLPKTFSTLTHITKLDLSKNELKELPDDFGNLTKLRHLDLYSNKLQHLPLSFSKLKDLRFLDLKDNPLVPTVAKIAGPCMDTKQCQTCARDVVNFFVKLEKQIHSDLEERNKTRQKQLEINQQKKQEEKKVKKKEKLKQKKQEQPVSSSLVSEKKKENKRSKTTPVEGSKTCCASVFKKMFKLALLTALILFVMTSVKFKFTTNVEEVVVEFYGYVLEKVPKDYKVYVVQFGKVFHDFHEKTGNATMQVVWYVDERIPHSRREQLLNSCKNIVYNFVEKVKELYGNFVSK